MEKETRVKQIQVRERRQRLQPPVLSEMAPPTAAEWTELPKRSRGWRAQLAPGELTKNLALLGCLALVVLAVHSAGEGQESVSAFSALKSGLSASWEQDIGKLSFVSELLPPEIREVWNPSPAVTVIAPAEGQTVHTWSAAEPYLEIAAVARDIRAAAGGEVMNIAHGLGEERILRLRHPDGSETLYGNLAACFVEVGQEVAAGDVVATLLPGSPLAFEMRIDGRSVDPSASMLPPEE